MARFLAFLLICMYGTLASGVQLAVQSRTITDLYGTAFLESLDIKDVVFLDRRTRQEDVKHAVTHFAEVHKFEKMVVLGQYQNLEGPHFPILTQFALPDFLKDNPVYILQGSTKLENERLKMFEQYKPDVLRIKTEYDLSKALVHLKEKPPGFIVLNVFGVLDNWGEKRGYKEIEEIVVQHRLPHAEVGVCYKGFKTALAVGPSWSAQDIATVLQHKNSTSICANLARLRALDRLDLYTQSAGKFYRVKDQSNPR